jgi:hypothetical protein
MNSNTIKCPNCGEEIEISNALATELRKHLEQEMADRLKQEKSAMWEKAQAAARELQQTQFSDLQNQLKEQQEKLVQSQQAELEFRKQKRDLEEKQRSLELEVQRKLDAERLKLEEQIRKLAGEEQRLKMAEKDKQLDMMRVQIEELRRKSEQGSMQIQGEVQEADLKAMLSSEFIFDEITDVPTGVGGADLVQRVLTQNGKTAGVILWESKNTKVFSDKWLKKLKDDQMQVKADLCILVSQAMPTQLAKFGMLEGVWVCCYPEAIALAHVLRHQLVQISQVRNAMQGQDEKVNLVMEYLSSPQFRNRIENLVSAFSTMQLELEKEKRALTMIWNRRSMEIKRMMENTVGFYGDLQGIAGQSIASVSSLELGEQSAEDLDPE